MVLKMVYEAKSLRLLGLQAVGKGDISRRVDVFSSFLQHGARIGDLFEFEHGYAPPFAEALDPLHHLAGVATAVERGQDFAGPGSSGLDAAVGSGMLLLDVREEAEAESAPLPESLVASAGRMSVVPIGELRARTGEFDRSDRIVVICKRGPRSYQAAMILRAAGFDDVTVAAAGLQSLI
jgi:rhodanese-related sulfurtransferase